MISGIHHVAIKVGDFEKALKFYEEGIGLAPVRVWGEGDSRGAMYDTGAGIFEIFAGGDNEPVEGMIKHIALTADDVDGHYKKALDAGAKPHMEPKNHTIKAVSGSDIDIRIAFVVAPTGELVEFLQEL